MFDVNSKPKVKWSLANVNGRLHYEQKQLNTGYVNRCPISEIVKFSNNGMDMMWEVAEAHEFYEIMALIRDERQRRINLDILHRYDPPFPKE